MTALAAVLLAAASFCGAADPAALKNADELYLHRNLDGKLAASTAKLQELVKAEPKSYDALWRLGRNRLEEGRRLQGKDQKLQAFAEASKALRDALAVKGDDTNAHYWLAAELGEENDIRRTLGLAKQMKKELEKALELDPKNADAHQLLGELLHQLPGMFGGDKKKAIAECEEALRLTPNELSRYNALAEAYLASKKKDEAVAALKKSFAVAEPADPGSAESDRKTARALLEKLTGSPEPK